MCRSENHPSRTSQWDHQPNFSTPRNLPPRKCYTKFLWVSENISIYRGYGLCARPGLTFPSSPQAQPEVVDVRDTGTSGADVLLNSLCIRPASVAAVGWLLNCTSGSPPCTSEWRVGPDFTIQSVRLFSSVQSLSRVRLFATPWIAARQASVSITNSWSLLKLMSIESVMPSSHHILCRPLLLLSPIPPSIRVFSSESTLRMRWPKYWSFSFSISPSMNTQDWSPLE